MEVLFLFFQLSGIFPDCHDFLNVVESGLPATSTSSLKTLWFISSGHTDLWEYHDIEWSWACSSLILGEILLPQTFPDLGNWEMGKAWLPAEWDEELVGYLRLLHVFSIVLPSHQWGYILLGLSFLTYLLKESLLIIFSIPCFVLFHLCLGFPDPVLTQPDHIPVPYQGPRYTAMYLIR